MAIQNRSTWATGGRPGWAPARLAREPGLGSRQSVEPVTGRFVDTTTCLQDERDEVVLVGVLRRFDRGVVSAASTMVYVYVQYHGTHVPRYCTP